MCDLKARIDELADLMREFNLDSAKLKGEEWCIEFSRHSPGAAASLSDAPSAGPTPRRPAAPSAPAARPEAPQGLPVSSPMMGIFYSAASPSAPPFVKVGDMVTQGQVVGLIEAMKVFNEITAPVSGKVTKMLVDNATLVQPGEPILYIG